jgi:hypothetical protein
MPCIVFALEFSQSAVHEALSEGEIAAQRKEQKMKAKFAIVRTLVAAISLLDGIAHAQDQPAASTTPATAPRSLGAYAGYLYRAGLTCGAGASTSTAASKPTAQCGGVLGLGFFDLETGVMGPQANRSPVSGYLSTNFLVPLIPLKDLGNKHGVPLIVGGYTRMFETGHALDYGVAFAKPLDGSHSIQFEVRDFWAFSNPNQHNVVYRVVWLVGVPD